MFRDTQRKEDIIYQVELINSNESIHEGDITKVTIQEGELIYDGMTTMAQRYWAKPPLPQNKEILTYSPIRIVNINPEIRLNSVIKVTANTT